MQFSKNICPFCLKEVVATATWCGDCGRDLPSPKQYPFEVPPKVELYEIVPDGEMFGIALQGKTKIHGLEMENAQSILTALNRRCRFDKPNKY
jgi:hypothetical protein